MSLVGVTFTGADDAVDPAALLALSAEFPFVEWGILFSASRFGVPRYPTHEWRDRLQDALPNEQCDWPALAAHFCGEVARSVLRGDARFLEILSGEYRRIQLNGWQGNEPSAFLELPKHYSEEFILQVPSAEALEVAAHQSRVIGTGRVSALLDGSGGRGLAPFSWPRAPLGLQLGYAGGITPDNVLAALSEIGPVSHDFWIDMESGVRTDDRFDLHKVRAVLEATAPIVNAAYGLENDKGGQ